MDCKRLTLSIKTQIVEYIKGWKNLCHADIKHKKSRETIIISDKVDFPRDREQNFIMLKGSIIQEDRKMTNVYAP